MESHDVKLDEPPVHSSLVFGYQNITYSIKVNKKWFAKWRGKSAYQERTLLNDISGEFKSGQLTAIIGPSGSGKTTLLNVLAGRLQRKLRNGALTLNGQQYQKETFRQLSAYVIQDDLMLENLTPRELLTFSAHLRLPPTLSIEEKRDKVTQILEDLELVNCADTIIGTPGIRRGVSGGERKRTSIGMELITDPSIILLDEPTSGLDSSMARSVVIQLQHLARKDKIVICTIHQPSSETFRLFDNLIVLSKGEIAYQGRADRVVSYYESLGFHCPKFTNPSEFCLDLVQPSMQLERGRLMNGETVQESGQDRISFIVNTWSDHQKQLTTATSTPVESDSSSESLKNSKASASSSRFSKRASKKKREFFEITPTHTSNAYAPIKNSLFREFLILLWRSSLSTARDVMVVKARFGQNIVFALLVGLIFLQIGLSQDSIQDRQGVLFFSLVNNVMPALMGVLIVFPAEKAVFLREYASGAYRPFSYFMAKTLADLPYNIIFPLVYCVIVYFLVGLKSEFGAFVLFSFVILLVIQCGSSLGLLVSTGVANIAIAMALAPVVFIPFILFGGFFQNGDSTPSYFIWMEKISPFKYSFEILAVNEFSGLIFECSKNTAVCLTGDDVLDNLGFQHVDIAINLLILGGIASGLRFLAYVFLEITARRKV